MYAKKNFKFLQYRYILISETNISTRKENTMERFAEIQERNHRLMSKATELENKAMEAIGCGNFEEFDRLMTEINAIQAQYEEYR